MSLSRFSSWLSSETGAGQWGSALAFAGQLLGIHVDVWMVRVSFDQKPFRKTMMETWGARCVASPSNETEAGRTILAADPDTPGSLGIAISEAVETAYHCDQTKYAMGSVLNHVMLHQTIIGLEAQKQFERIARNAENDDPEIALTNAGVCMAQKPDLELAEDFFGHLDVRQRDRGRF